MILAPGIVVAVKVSAQHQVTVCPRLQPKIHDLTPIQVVHDVLKEHVRHLLAVFVSAAVPQLDDLVHDVQAHAQFDGGFFGLRRARLPVGDLALVLLFDFEVFLARHFTVEKHRSGGFDAPPAFGNARLFLLLQIGGLGAAAMFGLNRQFYQHGERFLFERKMLDEQPYLPLDDLDTQRTGVTPAGHAFGMAVTQIAAFVMPAETGTEAGVLLLACRPLAMGAIEQAREHERVRRSD